MKAVRCLEYGDIETLVVQELPTPAPGPGEVLVQVAAAAVNFPDVLIVAGKYQVRMPTPFTPGSEFAGEVVSVGAGVSDLAPADRVGGTVFTGAFASHVVVPAGALRLLPVGTDLEEAAASQVTYSTAFHALHTVGALEPGQWVVVLGAAGGVGMATIDLARLHGARVLAAASGADKVAACVEAGADVVVDYANDDLKAAIKEHTGGGAHLVIDPVGGPYTELAVRALRSGGRLVVVGFATGSIPSLPLNLVLVKNISVYGVDVRRLGEEQPELSEKVRAVVADLLATGQIRPRIDTRFALSDTVAALRHVAGRKAIGKVLVVPDAEA
jgi:NADPH2:quinone reductase